MYEEVAAEHQYIYIYMKQYGADFEASALKTQLEIFGTFMAGTLMLQKIFDPFAKYSKPCHLLNKQTYHKFAYC